MAARDTCRRRSGRHAPRHHDGPRTRRGGPGGRRGADRRGQRASCRSVTDLLAVGAPGHRDRRAAGPRCRRRASARSGSRTVEPSPSPGCWTQTSTRSSSIQGPQVSAWTGTVRNCLTWPRYSPVDRDGEQAVVAAQRVAVGADPQVAALVEGDVVRAGDRARPGTCRTRRSRCWGRSGRRRGGRPARRRCWRRRRSRPRRSPGRGRACCSPRGFASSACAGQLARSVLLVSAT